MLTQRLFLQVSDACSESLSSGSSLAEVSPAEKVRTFIWVASMILLGISVNALITFGWFRCMNSTNLEVRGNVIRRDN